MDILYQIASNLVGPSGSLDLSTCSCTTYTPARLASHYPRCSFRLLTEAALEIERLRRYVPAEKRELPSRPYEK